MRRAVAEKYREIDFSPAKRGAVVKPEPGKTKISIRLDNAVLQYFRNVALSRRIEILVLPSAGREVDLAILFSHGSSHTVSSGACSPSKPRLRG